MQQCHKSLLWAHKGKPNIAKPSHVSAAVLARMFCAATSLGDLTVLVIRDWLHLTGANSVIWTHKEKPDSVERSCTSVVALATMFCAATSLGSSSGRVVTLTIALGGQGFVSGQRQCLLWCRSGHLVAIAPLHALLINFR